MFSLYQLATLYMDTETLVGNIYIRVLCDVYIIPATNLIQTHSYSYSNTTILQLAN